MNWNIFDYHLIWQFRPTSRAVHQHYGIILLVLLVLAQTTQPDLWEKYTKGLILFNSRKNIIFSLQSRGSKVQGKNLLLYKSTGFYSMAQMWSSKATKMRGRWRMLHLCCTVWWLQGEAPVPFLGTPTSCLGPYSRNNYSDDLMQCTSLVGLFWRCFVCVFFPFSILLCSDMQ